MDSVFRALAVYAALLILTRFSGRRTLSEVTVFDFVLILIMSETTDQALMGDDYSITNALLVIVTLVLTDIALSYLKRMAPPMARLIDGVPTVLISQGRVDADALSRARVDLDDILEEARSRHGLMRLDQIEAAVLEVGGGISIIPRANAAP